MNPLNYSIEHHALASPDKIALAFSKSSYTYHQLNDRIEKLADILRQHRLGAHQRINLLLPNSDVAVVGIFAILRAGACAVILNPLLHPEELMALSENSASSATLLTHRLYRSLLDISSDRDLPAFGVLVLLSEDATSSEAIEVIYPTATVSHERVSQLSACCPEANDALIVYTSGTSGMAKGVVLTHQNLLEKSQAAVEVMQIAEGDSTLMTLPLCHVFGLTRQLFPHLLQGASVQIVESSAPPDLLNHMIETRSITTFSGVPYHFHGMLDRGAGKKYPMRSLRLATSSSMRMESELRIALARALPHTRFSAQYGLTETSGFVTALPADLFLEKPNSVGRCIPGVEAMIAPSDIPSVAEFYGEAAGELLVRGCGVMSRYHKNAKATAQALDSMGWLKTGDLATIDADGDVTILSRKQFLIKRAGEFIIPEEVERVLVQHDAVDEACVFGVPDKVLGESVRAAVVLNCESTSTAGLTAYCQQHLARFKIPKEIIFVRALERTHTGKINKKAIADRYLASVTI